MAKTTTIPGAIITSIVVLLLLITQKSQIVLKRITREMENMDESSKSNDDEISQLL